MAPLSLISPWSASLPDQGGTSSALISERGLPADAERDAVIAALIAEADGQVALGAARICTCWVPIRLAWTEATRSPDSSRTSSMGLALTGHGGASMPVHEQHTRGGIEVGGDGSLGNTGTHQACNGQHLDHVFHVHSLSWFYVIGKA